MSNNWAKKRSVIRRYNLTALQYDARYCEEQEAKYTAALECVQLSPESSVLDVGSGSGLFLNRVAPNSSLAVGVDISKQLLLLARDRLKELANVSLILADADNLPFAEAIFSHVFAFTVLQNVPKPTETLAELKRVSKINAVFVVTGLKAAVPLEAFGIILEAAGLQISSLRDDEPLRCNVAVCVRGSN
jgi:ubiquinone/menaquinone biosynthesis C-methylase UbiE